MTAGRYNSRKNTKYKCIVGEGERGRGIGGEGTHDGRGCFYVEEAKLVSKAARRRKVLDGSR